ncbi:hypothetical protein [Massilia sp. erpn]|uniref:hypothetical protein n=1 Tax=Massilia sp. erpn TaxID=2738142 RepID=UPI002108534C|nr:hypothetical protein [Massilia sp. erpn]UTY57899.1 hypothetical protein HPQ68_12330 [Massilia sp. erpn]
MILIAEKRSRHDQFDVLRLVRNNGSAAEIRMPRQSSLPRDLLHYVVESALPLHHGFLSRVAHGAEADAAQDAAHTAGNQRAEEQLIQAESIVDGLHAQLLAGAFDLPSFLSLTAAACEARGKRPFDLSPIDVHNTLFEQAQALNQQWQAIPYCSTLSLDFRPRLTA